MEKVQAKKLGFLLQGNKEHNRKKYIAYTDLNQLVQNHSDKCNFINRNKLAHFIPKQNIDKILDNVTIPPHVKPMDSITTLFLNEISQNAIIKNFISSKRKIFLMNRKSVMALIMLTHNCGDVNLTAKGVELNGKNFPQNFTATRFGNWTSDYEKSEGNGLKTEHYVVNKTDYDLYAIMYIELGKDVVIIYHAEIDAIEDMGNGRIKTLEIKLVPYWRKKEINDVFLSRKAISERGGRYMPVLQSILGGIDKLMIVYTSGPKEFKSWKDVGEHNFDWMDCSLNVEHCKGLLALANIRLTHRDNEEGDRSKEKLKITVSRQISDGRIDVKVAQLP